MLSSSLGRFRACRAQFLSSPGELPFQETMMGDRSPKSKQRDQKQKDAAKAKEKTKKDAVTAASRVPVAKK